MVMAFRVSLKISPTWCCISVAVMLLNSLSDKDFPVSTPAMLMSSCPTSVAVSPANVLPKVLAPATKALFLAVCFKIVRLTFSLNLFLIISLKGEAMIFAPVTSNNPARLPDASPTLFAISFSTPAFINSWATCPPSTPED